MLDEINKQLDSNPTDKNTVDTTVKDNLGNEDSNVGNTKPENTIEETTSDTILTEDYEAFSLEELTNSLKNLIDSESAQKIKKKVEHLKTTFNKKFTVFIAEKKAAFITDGGNEIDFHFKSDIKYTFNGLLSDYKKKIKQHYKQLEEQRNENFIKKTAIIEEIKALITNTEAKNLYKEFQVLRDAFFKIGPVPREKNEDVWQTYRFHEQQVYDLLHLNSDFRNLDFKHNLEEKNKIANRAEELAKDDDVNKAFKELQILHRLWKEEIGPVAREFREDIWNRFKIATKQIHDKRQLLLEELEAKWIENIPKKEAVIEQIKNLVSEEITSHNTWQNKIKEMQSLRDAFFKIGKTPKDKSEELWQSLREITKTFNQQKNAFYKNVKQIHQENLDKKRALIDKAISLKDSDDLEGTTQTLKNIQAEWKTIGHVPRKFSDKMWKEFRAACNHFFDRLHAVQDEENKELIAVFEKKKEYLDNLKETITEDLQVTVDDVKKYIQEWRNFGMVPSKMRFINSKFNKVIDKLFSKLDMDKRDSEMMRFKNNMDTFLEENNTRKIENEAYFIRKKIDESTKEIKLLENNLGFFSNASPDNPMVKGVYKNIEKQQEDLDIWKQKLNYLKTIL